VKTVSDKVVRHSLAYLSVQKMIVRGRHLLRENFTTRFPMSLKWTSYVTPKPPKGGSKPQNGRFPCKIVLRLKKVCYKVRWRR